MIKVR